MKPELQRNNIVLYCIYWSHFPHIMHILGKWTLHLGVWPFIKMPFLGKIVNIPPFYQNVEKTPILYLYTFWPKMNQKHQLSQVYQVYLGCQKCMLKGCPHLSLQGQLMPKSFWAKNVQQYKKEGRFDHFGKKRGMLVFFLKKGHLNRRPFGFIKNNRVFIWVLRLIYLIKWGTFLFFLDFLLPKNIEDGMYTPEH